VKGLEAIIVNDGGTMAIAGITVVFLSLIILSFIISQLHKILLLWENKTTWIDDVRQRFHQGPEAIPETKNPLPAPIDENIRDTETLRQFNLLIKAVGEPFSLPELIKIAENRGVGHPHSKVNHLLLEKVILPDENGFYSLNHEVCQDGMRDK